MGWKARTKQGEECVQKSHQGLCTSHKSCMNNRCIDLEGMQAWCVTQGRNLPGGEESREQTERAVPHPICPSLLPSAPAASPFAGSQEQSCRAQSTCGCPQTQVMAWGCLRIRQISLEGAGHFRGTETFAQNSPVKLCELSLDQECRAELWASLAAVLEKYRYKSSLIPQVTLREKHPPALRAVWLMDCASTALVPAAWGDVLVTPRKVP